jgi:hypothetical protein
MANIRGESIKVTLLLEKIGTNYVSVDADQFPGRVNPIE